MNKTFDVLRNPLTRPLLGTAMLIAGICLYAVSQQDQWLWQQFCSQDAGAWCSAFRVALFDLGFKGVSYVLVFLGALLIVLYSLVAEIFGYILSFALNHVANASQVVIDAMERGRMKPSESQEIVKATIARYKGFYDERSESFAAFLLQKLIEQNREDGGFWRSDFRTNVEVRKLTQDHVLDQGQYLRWDETQKFVIWTASEEGTYHYSSGSSCEAENVEEAFEMLKHIRYDVLCNGKRVFSIDECRDKLTLEVLQRPEGFSENGLIVQYCTHEKELTLRLEKKLPISQAWTDIVVDEESFIRVDDVTYSMSLNEPTRGFNFRMSLPDGCSVIHQEVSGRKFGTKLTENLLLENPRENQIRADSTDWCLPGIVLSLAWKTA